MSAALTLLGSVACLLVAGLLAALALLARVERAHEESVGVRTEDRPVHSGSSGDVHLFVGFPASTTLDPRFGSASHAVPASDAADLLRALASSLDGATHAHADFGRFQPIAVREVPAIQLVYVHARTRKPVPTFVDPADRAAYPRTLEAIAALAPAGIVELRVGRATYGTDPAFARPVPLR